MMREKVVQIARLAGVGSDFEAAVLRAVDAMRFGWGSGFRFELTVFSTFVMVEMSNIDQSEYIKASELANAILRFEGAWACARSEAQS